jgi:hypothetical protein
MKSCRKISQRTHRIHSIGPKTHVLRCFGPFRYCTKVDAKLVKLVPLTHKFPKQSRVKIFYNERTGSTPFDSCFGAFRTILLLHESRCKAGRTVAFNACSLNEVTSKIFAMNAPAPLRCTQNSCYGAFQTISLLHKCRCKTGRNGNINAQLR